MIFQLDIFRALADPTRLRIVALLRAMELSVGELAQVLAQSQPRVSRHVKILCDAGLARRRKEGSWVFLCLGRAERMSPLFHAIDGWDALDGSDHWIVADAARLAAVRADRAASAQAYFAQHADEWDAIRSLQVAESQVEAAMTRALASAPIGRLVDIGTGTGRMIELFGPHAKRCIGIDRSPEMLRLARAKLSEQTELSYELQQGDITRVGVADAAGDTVIMHQVLHFLPAPELAIAEAARIVAPGGRLLIVDFAPHDREELRTRDAHARLGFSDEQISSWYKGAGLTLSHIEDLAGGELTVKLWLGTKTADARLKVVGL
jgi:ubiquinone/menaquinone biosynthesis C-methylase UbiE/DNA-binding transcriptional ArsR family regulator